MAMSRYEHWIRRYEHRRWTTDDNRMVRPFEWGLEHIGGDSESADPRERSHGIMHEKRLRRVRNGMRRKRFGITGWMQKMC